MEKLLTLHEQVSDFAKKIEDLTPHNDDFSGPLSEDNIFQPALKRLPSESCRQFQRDP
ncbi:hypothetical protein OMCYN_01605 [cyanobiont of Ornithocercus magnificus]|nr:hypothetical protein OMCYN_01605 [cyanobiont of Ornithocercus magnificus]